VKFDNPMSHYTILTSSCFNDLNKNLWAKEELFPRPINLLVTDSLVQSLPASIPEFNSFRDYTITDPVSRTWNLQVSIFILHGLNSVE